MMKIGLAIGVIGLVLGYIVLFLVTKIGMI